MKAYDFIKSNIGCDVYITGDRDLGMYREFRTLIQNKTKLTLLRLNRKGLAILCDHNDNDKIYSIPPTNIREYSELIK